MTPPETLWPGRCWAFSDRCAWEAARFGGASIGASDAPAIFGLSPWSGPWDLWARMVRGVRPERTDAEREVLARGLRFEATVIREYQHARPGARVVHLGASEGLIVAHPEHPWAVCSPDGVVFEGAEWGLLEAKTAMLADGWAVDDLDAEDVDIAADAVPRVYLIQCLWQLYVTGAAWVDLAVLLPRYDLRIVRIRRDEAVIAGLARKVAAWRERHIIVGEEPSAILSDEARRRTAQTTPADPKAKPVPAPEDIAEAMREIVTVSAERKALEEREEALKTSILARVTDETKGWTTGAITATVVRAEKTTLDRHALAEAHPDLDLSPYMRTSRSAYIKLTTKKEKS